MIVLVLIIFAKQITFIEAFNWILKKDLNLYIYYHVFSYDDLILFVNGN